MKMGMARTPMQMSQARTGVSNAGMMGTNVAPPGGGLLQGRTEPFGAGRAASMGYMPAATNTPMGGLYRPAGSITPHRDLNYVPPSATGGTGVVVGQAPQMNAVELARLQQANMPPAAYGPRQAALAGYMAGR